MPQSDSRPVVSVVIASSNTGAAAVEELLTNAAYAGRVVVRAVFRTEERAADTKTKFADKIASGDLQIAVGVDGTVRVLDCLLRVGRHAVSRRCPSASSVVQLTDL